MDVYSLIGVSLGLCTTIIMSRISDIPEVAERQRFLDFLARPDPDEVCPVKVLYYGHSFVSHMQDFMATLPYYMGNFGISDNEASVYFKALNGAPITRLRKKSHITKICRMRPEIVIVEGGTNDLADRDNSAYDVRDMMLDLVRDILDCGPREVIVSQVLLRGKKGLIGYDPNYREKTYLYNHLIEEALQYLPRTSFWHHRKLWGDIEQYVEDGTHLNDVGHRKLYRSLKGAIQSTSRRLRPAWTSRDYY